MGKFDFSPEALDEGLTSDDVAEFEIKCEDFAIKAQRVRGAGLVAEAAADVVTSYIKLGEEVFAIFGKAVASKAAKTEVPSTRKRFADTFRGFLDRFTSGKEG